MNYFMTQTLDLLAFACIRIPLLAPLLRPLLAPLLAPLLPPLLPPLLAFAFFCLHLLAWFACIYSRAFVCMHSENVLGTGHGSSTCFFGFVTRDMCY